MVWNGIGEMEKYPNLSIALEKAQKWKFNIVRLAIFDTVPDFARVDSFIAQAAAYNMKVIIDQQLEWAHLKVFGSQGWIDFWVSMATYYKGNPNVAAFELWNEPDWRFVDVDPSIKTFADMLAAYARCTDAIHTVDPSRIVVWQLWEEFLPLMSQYYRPNVVFTEHAYAVGRWPDNLSEVAFIRNLMLQTRSKGFGVWLGEIGHNEWEPAISYERQLDFLVQIINMCVDNDFGFCLWDYSHDHTFQVAGTYDDALAQSKYAPSTVPVQAGAASPFLLLLAGASAVGLLYFLTSGKKRTPKRRRK